MWCTKILHSSHLSLEVTILGHVCPPLFFSTYRLLLQLRSTKLTPYSCHIAFQTPYLPDKEEELWEHKHMVLRREPEHAKLLLSVHALPLAWQIAEVTSNAVRMVKLLCSQHSSTLIGRLSKCLLLANSCLSLSTCTDPVDPQERSLHLMGPVTQWRRGRPYILLKPTQ